MSGSVSEKQQGLNLMLRAIKGAAMSAATWCRLWVRSYPESTK